MEKLTEKPTASAEVLENFSQQTTQEIERWQRLRQTLHEALPIVEDLPTCNRMLIEAGRSDLQITSRAAMLPIGTPEEVIDSHPGNNFTPNFEVSMGFEPTGKVNPATLEPEIEPIQATEKELDEIIRLPLFKTFDEMITFGKTGGAPPIFNHMSHLSKPALLRMFVLQPEFTKAVIQKVSDPKSHYNYYRAMPEVFVAYQLMSRLVDESDLYVSNHDSIDSAYLTR